MHFFLDQIKCPVWITSKVSQAATGCLSVFQSVSLYEAKKQSDLQWNCLKVKGDPCILPDCSKEFWRHFHFLSSQDAEHFAEGTTQTTMGHPVANGCSHRHQHQRSAFNLECKFPCILLVWKEQKWSFFSFFFLFFFVAWFYSYKWWCSLFWRKCFNLVPKRLLFCINIREIFYCWIIFQEHMDARFSWCVKCYSLKPLKPLCLCEFATRGVVSVPLW